MLCIVRIKTHYQVIKTQNCGLKSGRDNRCSTWDEERPRPVEEMGDRASLSPPFYLNLFILFISKKLKYVYGLVTDAPLELSRNPSNRLAKRILSWVDFSWLEFPKCHTHFVARNLWMVKAKRGKIVCRQKFLHHFFMHSFNKPLINSHI